MSSFLSIYFGVPNAQPNGTILKNTLVNDLMKELGSNLSIVHGSVNCLVGNIGGESCLSYTTLMPKYKEKIYKLSSLSYGEVMEI